MYLVGIVFWSLNQLRVCWLSSFLPVMESGCPWRRYCQHSWSGLSALGWCIRAHPVRMQGWLWFGCSFPAEQSLATSGISKGRGSVKSDNDRGMELKAISQQSWSGRSLKQCSLSFCTRKPPASREVFGRVKHWTWWKELECRQSCWGMLTCLVETMATSRWWMKVGFDVCCCYLDK